MGHGYSKSKHYAVWLNMKSTCKKCAVPLFEEWVDYLHFRKWSFENGYKEGLFLERIDKRKGYFPNNLRFVHKEVPETRIKHGMHDTRLYGIWQGIKQRCHNPNDTGYNDYGGKGITVCEDWRNSFVTFYEWSISNHYNDDLTLDRIENDKGYSPDNCRWRTVKEQINNQDRNIRIEIDGETKTRTEWAEYYGVNPVTVQQRQRRHGLEDVEKLFEKAKNKPETKMITYNGKTQSATEWEKETGIKRKTIIARYNSGIRGEMLFQKRIPRDFEYPVEINGEIKVLKEWAKEKGIGYDTILDRYKRGLREEELIKPTGRKNKNNS